MADSANPNPLRSVMIDLRDSKGEVDSLHIEQTPSGALRISGWSKGKMLTHPLEVSEDELIDLIQKAVRAEVLSSEFLGKFHSDFEI